MVLRLRVPVWICAVGVQLATAGAGAVRAAAWADSPFGAVIAATETARVGGDASKGNRLAIVSGGDDALLVRVHLIRQAAVSVSIRTFSWTNDECGWLPMGELVEAARRGVKGRILADHRVSEQDPGRRAFLATVHRNLAVKH